MTLAALVIALLGAAEVSLVVTPHVTCVERARLVPRLESAGLRVLSTPSARLAVTVRLEQQQIVVRATRQGTPFERALPAHPEECDTIERLLAALIVSWSQQLPSMEPKRAAPSAPPIIEVPAPEPSPEVAPVVEASPLEPAPSLPAPIRTPLSVPRDESMLVAALPPEPAQAMSSFKLDFAALGGGSLGPTASVSGVGQLQVGASFGRLGALFEGGLESAREGTASSTRVVSSAQWFSLSGRVRFTPMPRLSLDFALGFRMWRITAQSFNTIDPHSLELLALGGVLSGGASLTVVGPISVHLRAFASARSRPLRFIIADLGSVLTLDPWEGGLLLGVEFNFGA